MTNQDVFNRLGQYRAQALELLNRAINDMAPKLPTNKIYADINEQVEQCCR